MGLNRRCNRLGIFVFRPNAAPVGSCEKLSRDNYGRYWLTIQYTINISDIHRLSTENY